MRKDGPKPEPQPSHKNKVGKVGVFFSTQNKRCKPPHSTMQLTTNPPPKHHNKTPVFPKPPSKKPSKSAENSPATSAQFFPLLMRFFRRTVDHPLHLRDHPALIVLHLHHKPRIGPALNSSSSESPPTAPPLNRNSARTRPNPGFLYLIEAALSQTTNSDLHPKDSSPA